MYKTVNTGSYLKYCTIASKRFLKPILIVMSMEKLPEFNQETMFMSIATIEVKQNCLVTVNTYQKCYTLVRMPAVFVYNFAA